MVIQLKQISQKSNLYDIDYNLWVLETVKKLENKDFEHLDLENLIEEVLDLSKRDKRKLKNLLIRLFEHLLKLKYWESEIDYNKRHWKGEIRNFRIQINDQIENSPSLKTYIQTIFEQCYQQGKAIASDKLGISLDSFPVSPIGNIEEILDENWLP